MPLGQWDTWEYKDPWDIQDSADHKRRYRQHIYDNYPLSIIDTMSKYIWDGKAVMFAVYPGDTADTYLVDLESPLVPYMQEIVAGPLHISTTEPRNWGLATEAWNNDTLYVVPMDVVDQSIAKFVPIWKRDRENKQAAQQARRLAITMSWTHGDLGTLPLDVFQQTVEHGCL